MRFSEFFEKATGHPPHPFQSRVASEGLPDLLRVPMGCGKSRAVVLGWLWRLRFGPPEVRRETPRRLVIALPMRTLVDQFERDVGECLAALDLTATVGLHVVMGGRHSSEHAWRMHADRASIVIGTVDSLVSKALNRGYGITRSAYPIDFALMTNGAHIVIDEIQLASASTVTLRQLAGFRRAYATAEPSGLTCMSATVHPDVMDTVDNPATQLHEITLGDADHQGYLGSLVAATKRVRQLHVTLGDDRLVAQHIVARHRPGTRTLVVVNTVKSAKSLYTAVRRLKPAADIILIHSRFRGVERALLADRLIQHPGPAGAIVIATQVVEAGVDIDSDVMITEASPWPSLCQRSGRCNRYAQIPDAELWWYKAGKVSPYAPEDVAEAERILAELEDTDCSGQLLLAQPAKPSDLALRVLRRPDFHALFDTAPDLSGTDIDIAPYIRDGSDQLDCQIAWVLPPADDQLTAEFVPPPQEWRCPAPLGEVRVWARTVRSWTFDVVAERWQRVRAQTRLRPGEVVVVDASEGGYDAELGFDPSARKRVVVAEASAPEDQLAAGSTRIGDDLESGEPDAMRSDVTNVGSSGWVLLDDHLRQTRDQLLALVEVMAPALAPELVRAATAAALTHDCGKVHQGWQAGLRATVLDVEAPDGFLAKSPGRGRLVVDGRPGFRHELLSALLVSHPNAAGLRAAAGVEDADIPLVRYLVAAHHGKARVQVRQPADSVRVERGLLGIRADDEIASSVILNVEVPGWQVDLSVFTLGAAQGWTAAALTLLDRHGPFTLAYLEMLVRVADWRASARLALASRETSSR